MSKPNNKFFDVKEISFSVFNKKIAQPYLKAIPKGGSSVINICDNFDWKNKGSTQEVPRIYAYERELTYGTYTTSLLSLVQSIGGTLNGIAGDPKGGGDIYPQLYASEPTGFKYVFPHLLSNNNLYSVNNNWQTITSGPQNMVNKLADGKSSGGTGEAMLEAGVSFAVGMATPGFGFDDVYNYSGTSPRTFNISFPLYNTFSIESAYNNYCFINLFIFQNLKTRTSLATYIPPKIYRLDYGETQGGIYSPVSIVQNLQVDCIGTTRRMIEFREFGVPEILMPEAYKVNITFMELVQNSSNIFAGSIGGDRIEVSDAGSLIREFEDFNRKRENEIKKTPEAQKTSEAQNTQQLTEQFPNATPKTKAEINAVEFAKEVDTRTYDNNRANLQNIVDQYTAILPSLDPNGRAYAEATQKINMAKAQLK